MQEKIAAIKNDEGFTGKMSFPWVSWLPRIMYSINTQVHATTKEMPYKLVFGQYPRSQLIPGAEQHIVNEEEITEITQSSSVPVSSDSSPAASTQSSSSVPVTSESSPATSTQSSSSIPVTSHRESSPIIPTQSSSSPVDSTIQESPKARNWIIQQETVLKWTPSSPSSCSSSSSRLPSLPSTSPEVKLTAPSKFIPSPTESCSSSDFLQEELSSGANKRKESESPESRHENIRKKARNKTFQSAIKMSNYYNKTKCAKGKEFKGQIISFSVPNIDSCITDMKRIPGEVVSVTGGDKVKFYKVATSAGIIKHAFRLGDLSTYTGDVKVNKNKVVSVRQAALEINAANKFTVNRCKCKGKCKTAQCSCIRSHISCSNHCHPGSKCENCNLIQKKKPRQEEILNAEDIQFWKMDG